MAAIAGPPPPPIAPVDVKDLEGREQECSVKGHLQPFESIQLQSSCRLIVIIVPKSVLNILGTEQKHNSE